MAHAVNDHQIGVADSGSRGLTAAYAYDLVVRAVQNQRGYSELLQPLSAVAGNDPCQGLPQSSFQVKGSIMGLSCLLASIVLIRLEARLTHHSVCCH